MPKPSSLVPSTAATSTPAAHHQTLLEKKYDRTGRQRRSVKFFIADSKLEAEYIRRFLGQLNPLEESRLCELKYTLQNQHKGKLPNDAHLLRFLRAREFDVSKAKDMVHTSILWRKQHNVDKILEEWRPSSVITQYFPGCWHNSDKEGRPLYVLRFGQLDTKGLLRSCGVDNLVKLTLCVCEEGLQRTAEATKKLGVPISSWSLLVDLEGLSMRHVWRPGVQCLLKIIEIVEANYPETMGQVLVIRAPRVFPVMWTLISPFIDERTRKKFMISGASDLKEELRKHIDEKFIPDHLGGPCLTNCGHGGHVPKNLYRPVEETELGASGSDDPLDSTYTATSTSKGCPVEVVIDVLTAGSVLTWDFDVVKNDCEFTVYFSQTKVSAAKEPHSPTMLKPVEMVSAAIGGSSHHPPTVSCAPDLVVGKDLYVEEKAVIFQEGDSMQGSHYCSRAGSYILQWKLPDSQASSSAFDFGSHKCRFMYFYEILNSADFRGSVASLESCRSSSFSSLAPPSPTTPVSRKS